MRALALGFVCSLALPSELPAQPAPLPPSGSAETQTVAALQKIATLNPVLHAVIATDPSAME